ncbi:hypothetical protein [Chitinibacter sp. GC72]|uniref:hypothetical protein n=1 Tax=Chitinibacter sp. GC72 TaxID=1526917 RepID=UPI0012F751FA|nr:hypothetical protein [Chitinibacter sp. GC72]
MKINEYLETLRSGANSIFEETLEDARLGKCHHYIACIHEFSQLIKDESERKIISNVCNQLESAILCATFGMYRQALSSLRLAFEMGLGCIYFSIYKMELNEWLNGKCDIKWSAIADEDNGILSKRFAKAFAPELTESISEIRENTKRNYRLLSEFVHGNSETWSIHGAQLKYNNILLDQFIKAHGDVFENIISLMCCRYYHGFSQHERDSLDFIREELGYNIGISKLLDKKNEQ